MLCNWCHEIIPEGKELKEKGGGYTSEGSGYYEEGGVYHRECYYKKVRWDNRKFWIKVGIFFMFILLGLFCIWYFSERSDLKYKPSPSQEDTGIENCKPCKNPKCSSVCHLDKNGYCSNKECQDISNGGK